MGSRWGALGCALCLSACGGGGLPDASPPRDATQPSGPHPLYPALDLDTLPGDGGGSSGPYEPPVLPATTRSVTITTAGDQARAELLEACGTPGTAVTVPDSAGRIGGIDLGHVEDCDITLGPTVIADFVYVGHLPGPTVAPSHRVRIRGGQIGSIVVDPGSSDIVFDGVIVNNAVLPPATRIGTAIYLRDDAEGRVVERFAFVNSIVRLVASLPDDAGATDGCAYLAANARDVIFANDNVVTAGNRNSWGFRIGGGRNYLFVDLSVRVSFHKLIRMNDGPVDYVYVRGGTWMREATLGSGGVTINDSFAQLGDVGTDHVFIHDPEIYLLSPERVIFGASTGPGQVGRSWEARRIRWHALDSSVVSDALLMNAQRACAEGAICDYGVGTHTYEYDPSLSFPENPWRDLPAFVDDDPDHLPIVP